MASDDDHRLAEVGLGVPGRMRQRHEHLLAAPTPFAHVVLDDRVAAGKSMLVPKPFEHPFGRVALLAVNRTVIFQYTVDDIRKRIQLRTQRRLAELVSRRLRMPQHLLHGLSCYAKTTGRFSLAQTANMAGQANS